MTSLLQGTGAAITDRPVGPSGFGADVRYFRHRHPKPPTGSDEAHNPLGCAGGMIELFSALRPSSTRTAHMLQSSASFNVGAPSPPRTEEITSRPCNRPEKWCWKIWRAAAPLAGLAGWSLPRQPAVDHPPTRSTVSSRDRLRPERFDRHHQHRLPEQGRSGRWASTRRALLDVRLPDVLARPPNRPPSAHVVR